MILNRPFRVIIDTNLWISFIISNKVNEIEPFLYSNKIRLLFCRKLLLEINQTTKKPKLQKYFMLGGLEDMISAFDPFIDLIEVSSHVRICRYPNDDFLLNLAIDGNADFLITGDKDLLEINHFRDTRILTFSEFLNVLEKYNS